MHYNIPSPTGGRDNENNYYNNRQIDKLKIPIPAITILILNLKIGKFKFLFFIKIIDLKNPLIYLLHSNII